MTGSNVSRETLERAAAEVGVTLDMSPLSANGRRWRIKVNPGPGGKARKYQRHSASCFSPNRRVYAVCWHGFRDFFRAVYRVEPDAVFRSALDTWHGSADFEARFEASGSHVVGAPVYPVTWLDLCECEA